MWSWRGYCFEIGTLSGYPGDDGVKGGDTKTVIRKSTAGTVLLHNTAIEDQEILKHDYMFHKLTVLELQFPSTPC